MNTRANYNEFILSLRWQHELDFSMTSWNVQYDLIFGLKTKKLFIGIYFSSIICPDACPARIIISKNVKFKSNIFKIRS